MGFGLFVALPAFADEPSEKSEPSGERRDEARRLFREAVTREDSGDHQGALKLYEEARTHAVSPQLLFNIANCEERLQRMLEAMKTFREAEAESLARGNDEVLRETRTRLVRLAANTPRLLVKLPEGLSGVEVELDAHAVEVTGESVYVNPGEHRIVARAPDGAVFDFAFPMVAGDARTVVVSFAKSTAGEAPTRVEFVPRTVVSKPNLVPAAIAGGVAVVLAGVSVVTFAIGRGKKDDYVSLNETPTDANRADRESLKSEGETLYTTSTIFGVGAAAAGGVGLFLLIRAVTAKPPPPTTTQRWLVPTTSGLAFGGTL